MGPAKHVTVEIAPVLSFIVNFAMEQAVLPTRMQNVKVIPIHKKAKNNEFGNYHRICVLPVIGKGFETIKHFFRISNFAWKHILFIHRQYRFISSRSTELALITPAELLLESIEKTALHWPSS